MHDCLRVPDIIRLIFDRLYDAYDQHWFFKRDSQFFALALTCRDFQGPALTKLWSIIHHIDPIIRCAERDLWGIVEGWMFVGEMKLHRPISASDIRTMKRYASLVRHIVQCDYCYSDRQHPFMTPDVWKALHLAFQGTTLFPNLQSVFCQDARMLDSPAIIGVQNLTSFTMHFINIPQTLVDFSARCPSLVNAWLLGKQDDMILRKQQIREALPKVGPILHNWRQLSRFISVFATSKDIEALSGRASPLRHLRIENVLRGDLVGPGSLVFHSMDTLEVGFLGFGDAREFINSFVAMPLLHSFTVFLCFTPRTPPSEWLDLFQSLQKHSNVLRKLTIKEWIDEQVGEDDDDDENANATPLANEVLFAIADGFPGLTHIEFYSVPGYDIDDENIEKLTEALPLIEYFGLYNNHEITGHGNIIKSQLTFACLAYFAKNCKSLTRLTLEFNVSDDDIMEEEPEDEEEEPEAMDDLEDLEAVDEMEAMEESETMEETEVGLNMKWLNVCFSTNDIPHQTAYELSEMFPNLQYLDSGWDPHVSAWSEVRGMLNITNHQGKR